jgi:hypothetical protein
LDIKSDLLTESEEVYKGSHTTPTSHFFLTFRGRFELEIYEGGFDMLIAYLLFLVKNTVFNEDSFFLITEGFSSKKSALNF